MESNKPKIIENSDRTELGLYIHIPFCAKKCAYCDFLSAPATRETIDRYMNALLTEIEQYDGHTDHYKVPTIFIGGGTPSVVDAGYIERIMEATCRIFCLESRQTEVTIEINPGTIDEEKLRTYGRLGINRLSFGLQSTDNKELATLGRIHTFEQFKENYHLARSLGFQNINIDLISAIPGQTVASWEATLNQVIGLKPEHISAYNLIIEEGTRFYDLYREGMPGYKELPDEDSDRLIYHRTKEILQENGYNRYEISNYAKKSYESRHNISYWTGKEYLGIGLGASSLLDGARFSNLHDIERYIELCNIYKEMHQKVQNIDVTNANAASSGLKDCIGIRENIEYLASQQKMEEFMFLGLRMNAGVSKNAFVQRFGSPIEQVYGDVINRMVKDHLLVVIGDQIRLTEYGIDISNYVLADFLLK